MPEQPSGKAGLITNLVVLALLAGTAIASLCLWYLGDWEGHAWALTLTLRILWGSWIVACLATILTRVTIFGWSFRQYFRWPGDGRPAFGGEKLYEQVCWAGTLPIENVIGTPESANRLHESVNIPSYISDFAGRVGLKQAKLEQSAWIEAEVLEVRPVAKGIKL